MTMANKFKKHYTQDEARVLLPAIQQWLKELMDLRVRLKDLDCKLKEGLQHGSDQGGETVNAWLRGIVSFRAVLHEFEKREIQVKDLERGLIDFPAFLGGEEVFLCWEKDEDDVEFWHGLDTGFAGRERLT